MITTEQILELRKITTDEELEIIISFAINPHSEKSRAMRNTKSFADLMLKVSDVFKQKESEMYSLMGYDRTGMLVEQFDVPTKEEADKTLLKLQEGDDKHDPIDWEVVTKGELDEA